MRNQSWDFVKILMLKKIQIWGYWIILWIYEYIISYNFRNQENSIIEKDENLNNQRLELENLKEDHKNLKSAYDQHLSDSRNVEKEKEILLKKVKSLKEEIKTLESELSLAKERKTDTKFEDKKKIESEDKESQALVKRNDSIEENSDVKKSNDNENGVGEKSVLEKPKQEFKFERHNIDYEVEKADAAYDDDEEEEETAEEEADNYYENADDENDYVVEESRV